MRSTAVTVCVGVTEDGRVCVDIYRSRDGVFFGTNVFAEDSICWYATGGEEAYTVTKPPHDRRPSRPLSGSPANCLFSSS